MNKLAIGTRRIKISTHTYYRTMVYLNVYYYVPPKILWERAGPEFFTDILSNTCALQEE